MTCPVCGRECGGPPCEDGNIMTSAEQAVTPEPVADDRARAALERVLACEGRWLSGTCLDRDYGPRPGGPPICRMCAVREDVPATVIAALREAGFKIEWDLNAEADRLSKHAKATKHQVSFIDRRCLDCDFPKEAKP